MSVPQPHRAHPHLALIPKENTNLSSANYQMDRTYPFFSESLGWRKKRLLFEWLGRLCMLLALLRNKELGPRPITYQSSRRMTEMRRSKPELMSTDRSCHQSSESKVMSPPRFPCQPKRSLQNKSPKLLCNPGCLMRQAFKRAQTGLPQPGSGWMGRKSRPSLPGSSEK